QPGRRVGETLHDPERVHRDLVEVLHARGCHHVHVGDLALAVEREFDDRPPVLVAVDRSRRIAPGARVDDLLRPDPPHGLLLAVADGPVRRLGNAERVAPLLAGELRGLLLALLLAAAAGLAVVAGTGADCRRALLGLVLPTLLLDLRERVLEEGAGLPRARLL